MPLHVPVSSVLEVTCSTVAESQRSLQVEYNSWLHRNPAVSAGAHHYSQAGEDID
jgi:hypothetical protein